MAHRARQGRRDDAAYLKKIVKLETPRLTMEQLTVAHAPLAFRLYSDPRVFKYLGGRGPRTLDEEALALERHTENTWNVYQHGLMAGFLKADRSFAGICGLLHWQLDGQEETEVAYAIVPEYWGKGYATEAALAIVEDAFSRLACSRLISLIMPGNSASINVALKMGMRFERQATLFGDSVNLYSRTSPQEETRSRRGLDGAAR